MKSTLAPQDHTSVMLAEAIAFLDPKPGTCIVDGTFGRGGHTQAFLDKGATVLALDCDEMAITAGQRRFAEEIKSGKLTLARANFVDIDKEVRTWSQTWTAGGGVQGVLFDLGVSSPQLADSERGLSFQHRDAPLDMRMDQRLQIKAMDLLALLNEKQLENLFRDQGGEHEARAIARAVVVHRKTHALRTVGELLDVIALTKHEHRTHLHPATKVMQALRIAVNQEMDVLSEVLTKVPTVLTSGGRVAVISFHEGEDRIVKNVFRQWQEQGMGHILTKKPATPGEAELSANPRARSAKLRVFEKN